ncbi:MAG: flagellar basal body-associated FliL family protein [Candidatus Krumholzibacteriia bacterium]
MAEEKNEGAPAPKAKPKLGALFENKVVLLGVIVIAQALTALAVTKFFIAPKLQAGAPVAEAAAAGGHGGAEAAGPEKEGVIVGLQEMIITLQGDAGSPHYARTNVGVEIADPKLAKATEERLPQLRDVVIMTLSSRTAADLLSPEGKEEARQEIMRRLGEKLPAGALLNVYFSDLMIQ